MAAYFPPGCKPERKSARLGESRYCGESFKSVLGRCQTPSRPLPKSAHDDLGDTVEEASDVVLRPYDFTCEWMAIRMIPWFETQTHRK
jgi:hypothetical protein